MNRRLAASLASTLLIAACGSSGPPGTTARPGATAGPGATQSGNGNGNGESTPGAPGGSGVTVRLVNAWGEADKVGPAVSLHTRNAESEGVLLTATPGQVTEFAELPPAEFGDGPAQLEAIADGSQDGIHMSDFQSGDRVTIIAHGEIPSGGTVPSLRIERNWEKGEQGVGLPWPTPGAGTGVIAVFPGPLTALPQDEWTVNVRTEAGECLVDSTFNEPEEGGFGGNGTTYLFLPKNEPTTLHFSTQIASGCAPLEPDIGTAQIDTSGGQRFAFVVWGMSDDKELITLDMGTP